MTADDAVRSAPPLPPGRPVELPGRGRTFIRECAGPPGAPTLLLLHGWTANADLNWFQSFAALGRRFRVVAIDHRGHGRGIRSRRPFRLRDCADDAAALVAELGTGPVVAVGYSMGGPVAQLLWKRHPEAVRGLVLCATARTFASRPQERVNFTALGGLALAARAVPEAARRRLARRFIGTRTDDTSIEAWVVEEMHRNDWKMVLEAGTALGRFDSRAWIGEVDVPTAVVVNTADGVVAPARQRALARSIPGAAVFEVTGDHTVCVTDPARFLPPFLAACRSVTRRAALV
ncbi:MAG: alpha/beta hydrolase [Acidimicrobiia bacterium]|nr:alpha/beta hydrolase [Acidimicrobiia bacterium]